jgi:hypothetical protein
MRTPENALGGARDGKEINLDVSAALLALGPRTAAATVAAAAFAPTASASATMAPPAAVAFAAAAMFAGESALAGALVLAAGFGGSFRPGTASVVGAELAAVFAVAAASTAVPTPALAIRTAVMLAAGAAAAELAGGPLGRTSGNWLGRFAAKETLQPGEKSLGSGRLGVTRGRFGGATCLAAAFLEPAAAVGTVTVGTVAVGTLAVRAVTLGPGPTLRAVGFRRTRSLGRALGVRAGPIAGPGAVGAAAARCASVRKTGRSSRDSQLVAARFVSAGGRMLSSALGAGSSSAAVSGAAAASAVCSLT